MMMMRSYRLPYQTQPCCCDPILSLWLSSEYSRVGAACNVSLVSMCL